MRSVRSTEKLLSLAGNWQRGRSDKKAAEAGAGRVSETMRHTRELFGGWPGAFVAQCRYCHKMWKASYQAIFQSIVFSRQFAVLDMVLDHHLWDPRALPTIDRQRVWHASDPIRW